MRKIIPGPQGPGVRILIATAVVAIAATTYGVAKRKGANEAVANRAVQDDIPANGGGSHGCNAGLTVNGMEIPREGVPNETAQKTLKSSREPAQVKQDDGVQFVSGKVSSFGGPKEAAKEDGPAALAKTKTTLRQLNPDEFYVAVRADYKGNVEWWKERPILIRNPTTGKEIVCKLVDWGPNSVSTGRSIDLSPGALKALNLDTDGTAEMAFASQNCPVGFASDGTGVQGGGTSAPGSSNGGASSI